jgi:hypothetical protein
MAPASESRRRRLALGHAEGLFGWEDCDPIFNVGRRDGAGFRLRNHFTVLLDRLTSDRTRFTSSGVAGL